MGNTTNRQASIDSRRVALEREIAIRVPRFDTFVTEYSSNISTTGMFIVSDNPQPPGTSFSFEFSVADDWKLIRGKAQVVWTRYRDEGPERPPGMGVRFLEVDAQSRRLVRWIVEKHIREGGKPFELDELRSVIDRALGEVLDTDDVLKPESQPSRDAPREKVKSAPSLKSAATATITQPADRRVWPLLLTAAAVLIMVGLLFWLTEMLPSSGTESASQTPMQTVDTTTDSTEAAAIPSEEAREETAATQGDSSAGVSVDVTAPQERKTEATNETAADSVPPVGSAFRSVMNSVSSWADAWSAQDASRYLSYYASSFSPNGGLSRSQWEAQRRERLAAPDFIKVSISDAELERLEDNRVQVVFSQSYRSNRFNNTVRKRMDLVWENGAWKIAREVTL